MFNTLVVLPIFNLLVIIYAFLPGHNFGLAIILFTILIRLMLWPLIKKQLHHTQAMRKLQPEIKKIKKASKGNRQQESLMMMELYKEREIKPFASIGILIVQLVILIGLYSGLRRVIDDPQAILDNAFLWVQKLGNLPQLAQDISLFDATLFGFVDLTKAALPSGEGIYWPAMFLVVGSAFVQYLSSKQLMPTSKDAKSLRSILKDAGNGKQADQSDVSAAIGGSTRYFIPVFILLFTVGLPSALGLYWFTSGLVAYLQQARILGKDSQEMSKIGNSKKTIIEGEIVENKHPKQKKPAKRKKKSRGSKKRRR